MVDGSSDLDTDPPPDIIIEADSSGNYAQNGGESSESRAPEHLSPQQAPGSGARNFGETLAPTGDVARSLEAVVGIVYVCVTLLASATAVVVVLSTSSSSYGVYPILAYSTKPFIIYNLGSLAVATSWLYAMRFYARAIVQLTTFTVPVILGLAAFQSVYASYHNAPDHAKTHIAFKIFSLIPLGLAILWVKLMRKYKHQLSNASEIVSFSVDVVKAMPQIFVVIACAVLSTSAITGLWLLSVSRGFLEGRLSVLLCLSLTFVYLWTWLVISAMLRCVIACIVSKWYYYGEKVNPCDAIQQALYQCVSVHFSACSLGALLNLLIRIPLVTMPRIISMLIRVTVQQIVGAGASALLDPLTLPLAAITQQSYRNAALLIEGPKFRAVDRSTYELAKSLLTAVRACSAVMVAFAAWAHADRVDNSSNVYGYLVGIGAFFIAYTVVGAAENALGMIVDALFASYLLDGDPPACARGAAVFAPCGFEDAQNRTGHVLGNAPVASIWSVL